MTEPLFFDTDCISAFLWVNNESILKDISVYVEEYGLLHVTTGDIMKMALDKGYIDEAQGNVIWANMIARRRKLGYATFSDYLADH